MTSPESIKPSEKPPKRHWLRGILVCLVIAAGLGLLWVKYSNFLSRGQQPPESTKILNKLETSGVPDFTLNDLGGKPISLSDYKGKIVLLNFWASWCEPCIKEFPSMMTMIKAMNGEVVLLAVSADYTADDIGPFLQAFKVESPFVKIMWDKDQELAKRFGTFKLPESYIIGRDGTLVRKVAGVEDWATPEAIAFFKDLIQADNNKPADK